MEQKKSRKEWIKTALIIFLSVLLVLTFFSNTIMNYSLPEVSAQYCYSGSVTNKVRGTGTVESTDPYSVVAKEGRKIESVAVRVGDTVAKGDVLYYLEDGESEELKTAKKELDALEKTYELAVITGQVSSSITNNVESGNTGSLSSNQAKIESAKAKIKNLNAQVETLNAQMETVDNNIIILTTGTKESSEDRAALINAQTAQSQWSQQSGITIANLSAATAALEKANVDYSANPNEATLAALNTAQKNYEDAFNANQTATVELAKATSNVTTAQKNIDDKIASLNYEKKTYECTLSVVEAQLKKATESLTDLASNLQTQYNLESQYEAINEKKAEIEKLSEEKGGATITAPVAGVILSMNYVAGESFENQATLSTIQIAGKGYTLSMNVTNEQAVLISVGDEAEITNSWWYSDVHARVTSIRPDPNNPSAGKKVIFELEGEVSNGQSLTLTVGRRTANYDYVVPTSAVKEDNNGKFVLRVNSKSTPLGNRYIVERVDVKVLAQDDTQSAVSGDFTGYDYIITTATKPLEDGQQVRLKD